MQAVAFCRGKGIALDIARGLFYLHGNNVVHLDIKVSWMLPSFYHALLP